MRIGGGAVSIADVTDRTARDLGFVRPFWLNEIRAGRAFNLWSSLGASVGDNSHIQLINPAGSGITVIVFDILGVLSADGSLRVNTHNVNLTTDIGTGANLLAGGAASVAHVRSVQNAGVLGTLIKQMVVLARSPLRPYRDYSWELGAGEGILVAAAETNMGVNAAFDWIEL
jgi:hypothetical protein